MPPEHDNKRKKTIQIQIDPKVWEKFSTVAAAEVGEKDNKRVGIRKLDTLMMEYVSARMHLVNLSKKLHKITKEETQQ